MSFPPASHISDEPRKAEAAHGGEPRRFFPGLHVQEKASRPMLWTRAGGECFRRGDVEDAFRASKESPLQQAFSRLGIGEAIKVYSAADPGEERQIQAMFVKKARTAMQSEAPAQRQQTLEKVRAAIAGAK
jgi:hypothetical protein